VFAQNRAELYIGVTQNILQELCSNYDDWHCFKNL